MRLVSTNEQISWAVDRTYLSPVALPSWPIYNNAAPRLLTGARKGGSRKTEFALGWVAGYLPRGLSIPALTGLDVE